MAHHWDSGFMVRTPSWHRLEKAVLQNSPKTWEEAREEAGLLWDVETAPVYVEPVGADYEDQWANPPEVVKGWQAIRRTDNHDVLSIRPTSYATITNTAFGDVIDTVLSRQEDEPLVFEALMSLYGGRQIVALMYFEEPLKMGWDPSDTFRYLGLVSRHDGNGGLRGLPTNVRIQCANTLNIAEAMDLRNYGFTIRHTSNWEDRLKEVAAGIATAKAQGHRWLEFTEKLAMWKVGPRQREAYLKRFLPISDADGKTKVHNTEVARTKIRLILEGDTCAGIRDNGYGLLMATTEWSDHYRQHATADSLVARQLLRKEDAKARSARILRTMANVKI